jgi:hypothetical protein
MQIIQQVLKKKGLNWQKNLTAVPYKFNVFYILIM